MTTQPTGNRAATLARRGLAAAALAALLMGSAGAAAPALAEELLPTIPMPIAQPADSDVDGIDDAAEARVFGTNPSNRDTDGDGMGDGYELYTIGSSPLAFDSDRDGVDDFSEVQLGTNPLDAGSRPPAKG